ncbi:MAG: hypothetical protein MUC99_13635 [Anaerolineae bacterium]|nr:hypothetical protein [Anaerolineae bacterium]
MDDGKGAISTGVGSMVGVASWALVGRAMADNSTMTSAISKRNSSISGLAFF